MCYSPLTRCLSDVFHDYKAFTKMYRFNKSQGSNDNFDSLMVVELSQVLGKSWTDRTCV